MMECVRDGMVIIQLRESDLFHLYCNVVTVVWVIAAEILGAPRIVR